MNFIPNQIEVLFDQARLHKSLHQLWRGQLVPLEDSSTDALRSIPNNSCVRLPEECVIYSDRQQGHQHTEHVQTVLF